MDNCIGTMVEIDLDEEVFYDADDGCCMEPIKALMRSLDRFGQVNIPHICTLTGMEEKQAVEALRGAIIRDPDGFDGKYSEGFVTVEEYLSGNLFRKLQIAVESNEKYNGIFNDNIALIRQTKPGLYSERNPYVTLGSPWLPPEVIDEFILYLLGNCPKHDLHVRYDAVSGIWTIPYAASYRHNIKNTSTYGTKAMNALKILEKTLNAQSIEIMKTEPSWSKAKETVDREATALALDRQKMILSRFDEWVYTDKARTSLIREAYGKVFGGITGRRYDGSFLTFPDMNHDVILRNNQRNAVARIVFSANTLLAHDVGTGKTYTMIAAAQELRRMGLSDKNMFVVPNAIIGQWENDYKYLYPNARVLVVDKRNFGKAKREQTLLHMSSGDYDAIIIAASSFSMIPLSRKCRIKELERSRAELMQALLKGENVRGNLVSKRMDRISKDIAKIREEEELAQLMGVKEGVCFDDLGITTLFVDEAHEYKNISIRMRSKGIRGISKKGSARCNEMLSKVHFTQRNGRGAVFATATPICNSMSDVFIMQTFLQSGELKFLGLSDFDSWANTFARRENSLELDVDGCSLKSVIRLSHFHNLTELSALFTQVADFYADGSSKYSDCDVIDVKVSCPPELEEFIKELSERAEKVRFGEVHRREDNLLKITVAGRMAALDIRTITGHWCDPTKTKSYRCAQTVYEIWKQTADEKLTQIIFCDVSTPQRGFNVYNEVRFQLMKMGVPMRDIAFIHDAATETEKLRLFDRMNRGDIRILIGSTQKLGTGVNVQQKLYAVHHLDIPWRPGDMTQREGRMLREGNECRHMRIYRYVVKRSFDAFSWSILERKQRFITEFMTNNLGDEAVCDLEEMALSFAEIKALAVGDPLLRRRIETENDLNRMCSIQRAYLAQRRSMEEEVRSLPDRISRQKHRVRCLKRDAEAVDVTDTPSDKDERKRLGGTVLEMLKGNVMREEERYAFRFMGFDIMLPANMLAEEPCLTISGREKYTVPMGNDIFGNIRRLENAVLGLADRAKKAEEVLITMENRVKELEEELEVPNVYADKIEKLKKKLEEYDRQLQAELLWQDAV